MLRIVDVTYHAQLECKDPLSVIRQHLPSVKYGECLIDGVQIQFVKHAGFETSDVYKGLPFRFFKGINKFFFPAIRANRWISRQKPDVVIVQGLGFPVQTLLLRLLCGKRCQIIIQHHGERPYKGAKLWFQKKGCAIADAFMFTAKGNAERWRSVGLIRDDQPVYEVPEASTIIDPLDKQHCRETLHIPHHVQLFLWVGRLIADKDPLTVLRAFCSYLQNEHKARLYMIYQTTELLDDIRYFIKANPVLKRKVILIGRVPHEEMGWWFSAADYFVSGSHREGSGYALIEAMACGCIPVVTEIPSFEKLTGGGEFGHLYPPGDDETLADILCWLDSSRDVASAGVKTYFQQHLTFKAIARQVAHIAHELTGQTPEAWVDIPPAVVQQYPEL